MDSKQLHGLMKRGRAVSYDGKKYDRILELISWYDGQGKNHLSAGLISGQHYVRVPADKVEIWEGV